jgi:hypothetical protein
MRLKDFLHLSENEKSHCLWEKGEPVAIRELDNVRLILYHIDDFYAEAEYKTDFNEIVMIRAFDVNELPEEYWKDIDISKLNV